MKDSVSAALFDYAMNTAVRFHMPGHKGRGSGLLPFDAALPFDVTELAPTDNLYDPAPGGVFRTELDFMRSVYGTAATVLTAGGATAAICAAFTCCARRSPGLPVLCDRKAHLSVINALALTGVEPVWFDAGEAGFSDARALSNKYNGMHFSAVFATSPDYYGIMRCVPALAQLAEAFDAPLIVDNSHGAHLYFHRGGALHPLKLGASLVVDSLHKTLPALTGAALLHGAADQRFGFTEPELLSALRLFVSTSPSYLISSSACACVRELAEHGEELHAALLENINLAQNKLQSLGFTFDTPGGDPFRMCISDADSRGLYGYLAENGVMCEFCDGRRIVLLTSVNNTAADFALLVRLCENFKPTPPAPDKPFKLRLPDRALLVREAMLAPQEFIPLGEASGRIAAAPAAPYPPGIAVIVPGEIFDEHILGALGGKFARINVAVTVKDKPYTRI